MLVYIRPSHKQFTCQYIPHPIHTSHHTLMGISGPESKLEQATIVANRQGCSGDVYPWIKISWTQTSAMQLLKCMPTRLLKVICTRELGSASSMSWLAGITKGRGASRVWTSSYLLSFQISRTSLSKSSHPGIKEKLPHLTPDRKRFQILTLIFACCVLRQVS